MSHQCFHRIPRSGICDLEQAGRSRDRDIGILEEMVYQRGGTGFF